MIVIDKEVIVSDSLDGLDLSFEYDEDNEVVNTDNWEGSSRII